MTKAQWQEHERQLLRGYWRHRHNPIYDREHIRRLIRLQLHILRTYY